MTDEQMAEILARVDALISKLGEAAEPTWQLLSGTMVYSGTLDIMAALASGFGVFCCIYVWKTTGKWGSSFGDARIMCQVLSAMVGVFFLIAFGINASRGLPKLLFPEYAFVYEMLIK